MAPALLWLTASLLAASAPSIPGQAAATRAQIERAASQCGLAPGTLDFGEDGGGAFADFAKQRARDVTREGVMCLMRWATGNRGRVTVFLEPNPRRIAYGPPASIRRIDEAADRCGLRTYTDPVGEEAALLNIRRHAPAERVRCLEGWIEAHRAELGLQDMGWVGGGAEADGAGVRE
jgi:hypothetical protein